MRRRLAPAAPKEISPRPAGAKRSRPTAGRRRPRTRSVRSASPTSRPRPARPSPVPNGGATTFAYNPARQLTQVTRPDGQTVTETYDGAGRLASVATAVGAASYSYDGVGRLSSVTAPAAGGAIGYQYDGPLV